MNTDHENMLLLLIATAPITYTDAAKSLDIPYHEAGKQDVQERITIKLAHMRMAYAHAQLHLLEPKS